MPMTVEMHEQFAQIRERLASIEKGQEDLASRIERQMKEIVTRVDRQNGRVGTLERDLTEFSMRAGGKMVAHDNAALYQTRAMDAVEEWRKALAERVEEVSCRVCDPTWRERVDAKLEAFSDLKARLTGGWAVVVIISIIAVQFMTFALAISERVRSPHPAQVTQQYHPEPAAQHLGAK